MPSPCPVPQLMLPAAVRALSLELHLMLCRFGFLWFVFIMAGFFMCMEALSACLCAWRPRLLAHYCSIAHYCTILCTAGPPSASRRWAPARDLPACIPGGGLGTCLGEDPKASAPKGRSGRCLFWHRAVEAAKAVGSGFSTALIKALPVLAQGGGGRQGGGVGL